MLIVETERLIVRRFQKTDVAAMAAVFGDVEVMRYGDGVRSSQWVRNWVTQLVDEADQIPGVSPWAVEDKMSSETIGYCGLFYFPDVCGEPEIEVGYRLAREHWGRGYATEAVCAVRDHAFYVLDIPRLIALIDPGNLSSMRVAEKAGFYYEKNVMLEGYTYPDRLYANIRSKEVKANVRHRR